ncbi:MAG: sigma-70 family RNA polymerase sigma factor [Planctomycetaceae bacterium]|jgi:RNA polymerase primary sigma factor/RNA polymerase sigma factor|nr:sigma-70 family RNA polymerase sigma factor [Planctomycetaceae bacterium]
MNHNYQINVIRELRDQQVRYAPREKKIDQSRRAELLYREVSEDKDFSYMYVCMSITEFKTEMYPDLVLGGSQLKHDLLLLVDDLYDSANVTIEEAGEKVWTIEELTAKFKVASKTISRWRKQGLVSRKFIFGRKKRVGFLQSSLDYFMANDSDRIKRGEKFSQLTADEKELIIKLARRFSNSQLSPTEVAKRIARYMKRSVETVRYTVKSFDENNTDIQIFPNRHTPLDEDERYIIFQKYCGGISIEQLAKSYDRTRGSIYRTIGQMRAVRISGFNFEYIDSTEFHSLTREQEKVILAPASPSAANVAVKERDRFGVTGNVADEKYGVQSSARRFVAKPDFVEVVEEHAAQYERIPNLTGDEAGILPYISNLYKIPLLSSEQEVHLFRKMNYIKYKAAQLRAKHDAAHPKAVLMTRIEELHGMANAVKNEIVAANLRLVVSIAKRHVGACCTFFDLVSDGNLSLLRAVEKFDYSRGNRFSTYATWAITRNYARTIPDEKRHRDRYHLNEDELLEKAIDRRSDLQLLERYQVEREQQVDMLLNTLNEREQRIIVSRFGIGHTKSPLTLNEVGVEIGITKERVRQIEARALAKLRKIAENEKMEIPGL